MSVFMELGVVFVNSYYGGSDILLDLNSMGGWVVYDSDDLGLIGEGGAGVAALYGCSAWLMVVSG